MSLQEGFQLAAQDYFDRAAEKLTIASQPRKRPEPLLTGPQELARQSLQPDRLVAVNAAPSPLFEAARPLLNALANMPEELDAVQVDALHVGLVQEVISFQSVCQDAKLRYEYIVLASYAICTALDEAAGKTKWGGAQSTEVGTWAERQLAVRFHGDNRGGRNVFRAVGFMVGRLEVFPDMLDLLELASVILGLGFEGVYRHTLKGQRMLDDIRYRVLSIVDTSRKGGPEHLLVHWQGIERFIGESIARRTRDHVVSPDIRGRGANERRQPA